MSKQWDPSHIRLATSAANVRDKLRQVDWQRLDPRSAAIIAACVKQLTAGLKCRAYRSSRQNREVSDAA